MNSKDFSRRTLFIRRSFQEAEADKHDASFISSLVCVCISLVDVYVQLFRISFCVFTRIDDALWSNGDSFDPVIKNMRTVNTLLYCVYGTRSTLKSDG